jgi:hypothetical protein
VDIVHALIGRYFRDEEAIEILQHKDNIVEVLQSKAKMLEDIYLQKLKEETELEKQELEGKVKQ